MAAKVVIKTKKTRPIKGVGRKTRRQAYALYKHDENKKRKSSNMVRHLLLAKARRYRNHPEKATEADAKAFLKLAKE